MALIACFFLFQTIPTASASEGPHREDRVEGAIPVTIENAQSANVSLAESDSVETTEDDLDPELHVAIRLAALDHILLSSASRSLSSWSRIRKQHLTRAPPQV
ncbi:MAG: hypothetical protein PsegKO_28850 [Pseudohongiellaceae bacterium]